MKFQNIFKNNRLLVRLIASFLIISVLLTGILMIVVSSFVSSNIKTQTTNAATNLLKQSYSTAYYSLTDIYGDYYDLWTKNETIIEALKLIESSTDINNLISDLFDREIFKNDLLDSIYLINKTTDMVISNISTYTLESFYDKDALGLLDEFEANYDSYKNELFFPRITEIDLENNKTSKNLISIIYAKKNLEGKITSGIIVNIDQRKLSTLINIDNDSSQMIVVNSRGKIISDLDGRFGFNIPKDEFYASIANNSDTESSLISDYLGEKSFVTYKKAPDLGLVFISITSYSALQYQAWRVEIYMALFFLLAMVLSLIFSFIAIKKIYEPLNSLIQKMKDNPAIQTPILGDEYEILDNTYNSLVLKDKSSHIARIFNGSYGENALEVLNFKNADKFMTFVVIPDESIDVNSENLESVVDIINQITPWSGAITSNNCISCIINSHEFSDEKIDSIMEGLINLQKVIAEELNITVSIGLGTMVNNLDSIRFSHRYAILAAQYAIDNGDNQVVIFSDIENNKIAASQNKDSIADKIQEIINNNFTRQNFSADEVATEIDLSLSYARQIFKNEKGISLNDYIINCRIEMSKSLLISTDKTAKDIAEEVGYYDNRYFYTLFKKKVGMTTDEFRNSMKDSQTN